MVSADHLLNFYIEGRWVEPEAGGTKHDIINPATGEVAGVVAYGTDADVHRAVYAAARAFPKYAALPQGQRNELLEAICAEYERRLSDMAEAITAEMGAPLETLSKPLQAQTGLWHFQTALAIAGDFKFDRVQGTTRIVREPVGVCALITPWNWPINQIACKVAPALAVGCSVVLKPSQNAPYSAALMAEILHDAGVPAGVFNMVQGSGAAFGELLASHPQVDMVSLTGSNAAGASVTKAAADSIKRVSLELGGKSANIILPTADLEKAVAHGVTTMMHNSGQTCVAPSRMLVPQDRLEEVEAIAKRICESLVVGDPLAADTFMGPIANARQYKRVVEMIELGVAEGAYLVTGGAGKPAGCTRGYFVKPTVFSRVRKQMTIAREEIFGPVLTILPYATVEEAIDIANDSPFGLSGYVYGATIEEAQAIAYRLRTGMVHLNGANVDMAAPWGGYKQSGNGREWGAWGFDEFLETKAVLGAATV
ncbi:aldehyde dehydrogenase family protein [Massilia orientalis]|uniref:Aldehyde dehydrogenase family protein n=1 Tax=Massilia orientalis TaxID=3050128 RepID=A0ACC7MLU7_9BURK|nr:aldehyde dehydrogenase family protein [Massilia sp. YIM B02787]